MGFPAAVKFAALTADGNSNTVEWTGGRGVFVAYGTFGGGTYTLQWTPDDGTTWLNVDQGTDTFCTLTAPGSGGFELPFCQLRCVLTGATSPSVSGAVESTNQH